MIAPSAVILSRERLYLGANVRIDDFALVGRPNQYPDVFDSEEARRIKIGDNTVIGPYSIIYEGATIGDSVVVEARGLVGSLSTVGDHSRLDYGGQIHDDVYVGEQTLIAGFVADHTVIGNKCFIFGHLIHKCRDPSLGKWNTIDEEGPRIGDNVIIGWNAIVVGNVAIGSNARVLPGAIVRSDVAVGERYGGTV